mmetsp:Transcript_10169/g.30086  ORF Transcript_10169/g.30086 Transcript_10169/m.30086 type:complete len:215 (-) Transcript_10169:113-757(-)
MHVLEWSMGSSSAWLLRRVKSLCSIEHFGPWVSELRACFARDVESRRWTAVYQPCVDKVAGGCKYSDAHTAPGQNDNSAMTNYAGYVAAARHECGGQAPFDLVSVDGRARNESLWEALLEPSLVRPDYGMLLLDNAELDPKRMYAPVPRAHDPGWICVSFRSFLSETAIWMRCPEGRYDRGNCERARREIGRVMARPGMRSFVDGTRCAEEYGL